MSCLDADYVCDREDTCGTCQYNTSVLMVCGRWSKVCVEGADLPLYSMSDLYAEMGWDRDKDGFSHFHRALPMSENQSPELRAFIEYTSKRQTSKQGHCKQWKLDPSKTQAAQEQRVREAWAYQAKKYPAKKEKP